MIMLMAILLLPLLFIIGLKATQHKLPTNKLFHLFTQTIPQPTTTITAAANQQPQPPPTTADREELAAVFATFDQNKDGFITKTELRQSLTKIGFSLDETEVEEMIRKADSNSDGLIDLEEFRGLFGCLDKDQSGGGGGGGEEDELKEAFDVFDGDGDGVITGEELGMVLCSLGFKEGNRLEDCKEMIRRVDRDGDGMVNFDEFKRMIKSGRKLIPIS